MVTGVLNDSTNQPTKRPKQQRVSSEKQKTVPQHLKYCLHLKRRHSHLPIYFQCRNHSLLRFQFSMVKLFEDLFRNNIKMYPHLTEIQKMNYFHSLLRGNALQAYCNCDDTKKNNLEEVITAFKRRFGDFQSSAKARCEWDAQHSDPNKQKLHEFLDILQNPAKEAIGSEAQKFIDKAIYAKMPDHVKKILNRAYLEDKPYNDIVLHLERETRLHGLGAPDETTLVQLNTVDAVVTDDKKEQQQRGYCFHCGKDGHYKAQCRRLRKGDTMPTQKRTTRFQTKMNRQNPNAIRVAKRTKPRTAGTELMRQMTPGKENENSPSQQIRSANNPYLPRRPKPRLRFGEKVDARAYTIEDPKNRYGEDFFTECNEQPTQNWQRRWNVGMILRHNARHPEDPTPLPQWITESHDKYATLKRHLPVSKTESIYIYDMDYRCDPSDEPTIYDTNKLSFKIQIPNPQAQPKETTKLPSPPPSIFDSTHHHYVHADRRREHHLH